MLRWHLQKGRQPIPESVTPKRIVENIDIFDFWLSDAELDRIDGLEAGIRGGSDPGVHNLVDFAIDIPDA